MQSKLPGITTTIFTVMSQLAAEHKAINLSQGFPDFEVDQPLKDLVSHYVNKGFNQYAPMAGIMPLREAIAAKTFKLYNADYNPESDITITSGATEAIFNAVTAFVKEGDEVIIFEPAYDSYIPAIKLSGGIPVPVQLQAPSYSINWEDVKKLVTRKTKMIIINSPHNPSGQILEEKDLLELQKIIAGKEIIVISDEVYEHIVFDGKQHESVMKYPALREKSLVVFSFGKTFHATGWKIGYCIGPAALMAEFRKVHQYVVFSTTTFLQYALADYMKEETYLSVPAFYQKKRDKFLSLIKDSGFTYSPASGSYFQCVDYSKVSQLDDLAFAKNLVVESGVAAIPLSPFYLKGSKEKMIRFCFAKSDETLERAAERLCMIKEQAGK